MSGSRSGEGRRPDILMTGDFHSITPLDARFTVHRLWQIDDSEAFLSKSGSLIRGIAAGGHSPIDEALMARLPELEIIAKFGVGYDTVDVAAANRRGVVVTNTPDVLTEEVADLALGLLIATVRRLPQADRFVREGRWVSGAFPLSASLRNRRIGIVGLGRIGKAIARRCTAMGLEVRYYGRNRQPDVSHAYHPSALDLASAVDVLIITSPGGAETKGLISADVLDALGPEGVLINISRGSVVDQSALIAALRDRRILAAGLDVFEDEPHVPGDLIALDNVVLLPHVGSASRATREAMGELVVENLISWFDGRGALTPVPEARGTGRTRR